MKIKKRPNLLFFFTDDQRFDTIRQLGYPDIHTPHMDQLVERGTSFLRAHIPGGTCGAVCMPSRAMLHTGRTLFHLDREGQTIPEHHVTLGQCFREAGYETFGTGKWHNGRAAFANSFSAGDQIFFGGMADHWNVPVYHFDPTGQYAAQLPYIQDPLHTNRVDYCDADHIENGVHSTDLLTSAAVQFIANHEGSKPFFMYTSYLAPHDPRSMPEPFASMYDPDTISLPPNFQREHPVDIGQRSIRDELLASYPRDPAEIRRHIADYYGMISHLDHVLGQLMDALQQRNELDNTIIILAGDNGLALGQHGLMGKQNLYECSVRVPLVLAGPGIAPGARSDALVYLLDIFPTLCDLAELETPSSVEGCSFSSCLTDPESGLRADLYLAYADAQRGVSNGHHKLIEYACGYTQLFDLKQDPHETRNLADAPEVSETLSSLRVRLRELAVEWDDRSHPKGAKFWDQRSDLNVPDRV